MNKLNYTAAIFFIAIISIYLLGCGCEVTPLKDKTENHKMKNVQELLYPKLIDTNELEYDWEGYEKVILFSSNERFNKVKKWYLSFDSYRVEEISAEKGSIQLDFYEKSSNKKRYELLMTSLRMFDDGLESYMASEKLSEMARKKPKCLGCLFIINEK